MQKHIDLKYNINWASRQKRSFLFVDLSYQAAQRVVSAPPEEALKTLRDISQNFPVQARSLVKTNVKNEMRKEIQKNQKVFILFICYTFIFLVLMHGGILCITFYLCICLSMCLLLDQNSV